MAKLTRDDIRKLARLARIDIAESEIDAYAQELDEIIQYVQMLKNVDVDGLQPTNQVTGLVNVMRADEVQDFGYAPADLLKNAPAVESDHLKVQRMIG